MALLKGLSTNCLKLDVSLHFHIKQISDFLGLPLNLSFSLIILTSLVNISLELDSKRFVVA